MVTKEDYILLCAVLKKMEVDINYKATYPEQTAIYSVLSEADQGIFQTEGVDNYAMSTAPNLLLID